MNSFSKLLRDRGLANAFMLGNLPLVGAIERQSKDADPSD
jgi:hypothetical protein